ncbi:hypothetical protein PILCRDRAFT_15974 [Piloderma croceum F 1598]|uniref:Uncharacterized protein n=1 Tax=Piloderma croceum (strain F 1598) TaxID=765440 RepID=A0A0C3AFP5_PILCF|nr:hypothetical protein PILCRDRAFT_15974 [Piloderma croceum F 1598]
MKTTSVFTFPLRFYLISFLLLYVDFNSSALPQEYHSNQRTLSLSASTLLPHCHPLTRFSLGLPAFVGLFLPLGLLSSDFPPAFGSDMLSPARKARPFVAFQYSPYGHVSHSPHTCCRLRESPVWLSSSTLQRGFKGPDSGAPDAPLSNVFAVHYCFPGNPNPPKRTWTESAVQIFGKGRGFSFFAVLAPELTPPKNTASAWSTYRVRMDSRPRPSAQVYGPMPE